MPLAPCRECGREVSSEAAACPHCGVPRPTASRSSPPPGSGGAASPFRRPPVQASVPHQPSQGGHGEARKEAQTTAISALDPYVHKSLVAAEQVLYRAHLSAIYVASWPVLLAVIGFCLLGVPPLAFIILVIPAIAGAAQYLNYRSAEFALTDRRVLAKQGVLSRRSLGAIPHPSRERRHQPRNLRASLRLGHPDRFRDGGHARGIQWNRSAARVSQKGSRANHDRSRGEAFVKTCRQQQDEPDGASRRTLSCALDAAT